MSAKRPAWRRGIALEPLLTDTEVMAILRVSRPKLRELVRVGRLPAVVFMRHRRYLKQDVVDFVEGSAPRNSARQRLMITPRHGLKWTASVVSKDPRQ
jgi:excisionase family DNA binding protein